MKRVLLVIGTLLLGIYFFGGSCDRLNYEYRHNQHPTVYFVNIPTQDSKFSSDTTIYWHGTDVDGFIDFYRYAVVEGYIVNNQGGPVSYLAGTDDSLIPWDTINVTRDDPGTSDEIKMSADISDPVRKYMTSYIFLQAVDNLGLKSEIIYRTFKKNSHFPNTYITAQDVTDPYVNSFSALSGVSIAWYGVDSADYTDPPPFVYKWKLFGPYTDEEMAEINNNYIDSLFLDKYGDIYFDDDSYPIDDTTRVPVLQVDRVHGSWETFICMDTIIDTIPPVLRTFLPIPGSILRVVDSSGMDSANTYTYRDWVPEWSTDMRHVLYNVYYNSTFYRDTTCQYNFLLWCQCRDDSRVMDAVPAFKWISVIDPKFERDIIVLDMTQYKEGGIAGAWNVPQYPRAFPTSSPWSPDTPVILKMKIGSMINEWAGNNLGRNDIFDFDILEDRVMLNPNGGECKLTFGDNEASQDFYSIKQIRNTTEGQCGFPFEVV